MKSKKNLNSQAILRKIKAGGLSLSLTHTHTGLLLSQEQEENPVFCHSMDGPGGHYVK